jgi:hypothetical protein
VNPGGLFINLESMWDDYEQSIDSMIKTLAADDAGREKSVEGWRGRRWAVQLVQVPPIYLGGIGAASAASVSFSETAIKP